MNGPYKPFETEREARAAAHAVIAPECGSSILTGTQNRQLIGRALEAADVTSGRYDDRIAEWLAQYEDAMCAVIAGWVTRAAASHAPASIPGAELAARRTAAAAVLADFKHAADEFIDDETLSVPQPDYSAWAFRLSTELGSVLRRLDDEAGAVVPSAVTLSAAQYAVVARALADAEAFLRERAGAWCEGCKTHPAGACEQHVDDLDQADEYRKVAAELAQEAGR